MKLAHAEVAAETKPTTDFPVYGNAFSALFAMIVSAIVLLGIYKFFVYLLKRAKKRAVPVEQQVGLAKVTTGLIVGGVMAAGLDVWWHRAVGRDTLFVPPHLLMYFFIGMAVLTCFYGLYKYRSIAWQRIAFFLILILLSAPFDNYWHVLFGVEDLTRPISLSWAPPHMMLDLGAMCALLSHIPILLHDHKRTTRTFFIDVIFATTLGMLSFLVMPLHPTEGWGAVLDFYGAGVLAFVYIFALTVAQKLLRGEFDSVRITAYFIVLTLIGFGKETAPGVRLLPHDRPPVWIFVFSFIGLSVILDTLMKLPLWLRGGFAGAAWAIITFGLERYFFAPEFVFGWNSVVIATLSSFVGGTLGVGLGSVMGKQVQKKLFGF